MVIAVDITQYCFTPHCVAQVVVPHSSHPLLPIIILYTLTVTFLLLLVKRATFLQSQGAMNLRLRSSLHLAIKGMLIYGLMSFKLTLALLQMSVLTNLK